VRRAEKAVCYAQVAHASYVGEWKPFGTTTTWTPQEKAYEAQKISPKLRDVPKRLYDMVYGGPVCSGDCVVGGFLYGAGEECTWLNTGSSASVPLLFPAAQVEL
jgi:hypothetical protein